MDGNEKLYDFVARSEESALLCLDPSKTVQSDMTDADINVIVARFGITGTMPQGLRVPEYADYEDVFDYHSAMLVIKEAEKDFMSMPADVRAQFDNDPGAFFDFASDPDNIDALRDMGLAVRKEVVAPVVPPVVDKPSET